MSLPDITKRTINGPESRAGDGSGNRGRRRAGKMAAGIVLLLSTGFLAACSVQPLYSNQPASIGGQRVSTQELASISVKPVDTRYAQEVRKNLIFGLTRGQGQPATPVYSLDLNVTEQVSSVASIQVTKNQDEPSAGMVTLTANYRLTEVSTGKLVGTGRRSISSSFDRPKQEFATYRAQLDAQNRAARELAGVLQLALALDLSKQK